MSRPLYLVYKVESMTGSAFQDDDVPDRLRLIGTTEAINGDHAREIIMSKESDEPVLVLRANTVMQHGLKIGAQS